MPVVYAAPMVPVVHAAPMVPLDRPEMVLNINWKGIQTLERGVVNYHLDSTTNTTPIPEDLSCFVENLDGTMTDIIRWLYAIVPFLNSLSPDGPDKRSIERDLQDRVRQAVGSLDSEGFMLAFEIIVVFELNDQLPFAITLEDSPVVYAAPMVPVVHAEPMVSLDQPEMVLNINWKGIQNLERGVVNYHLDSTTNTTPIPEDLSCFVENLDGIMTDIFQWLYAIVPFLNSLSPDGPDKRSIERDLQDRVRQAVGSLDSEGFMLAFEIIVVFELNDQLPFAITLEDSPSLTTTGSSTDTDFCGLL